MHEDALYQIVDGLGKWFVLARNMNDALNKWQHRIGGSEEPDEVKRVADPSEIIE